MAPITYLHQAFICTNKICQTVSKKLFVDPNVWNKILMVFFLLLHVFQPQHNFLDLQKINNATPRCSWYDSPEQASMM